MADLYVAKIVRSDGRRGVARIPREAFAGSELPQNKAVIAGTDARQVDLYVSPTLRRGIESRHPILSNARYLAAASHIASTRNQYLWVADIALVAGAAPNEAGVRKWRKDNRVANTADVWPARWQPDVKVVDEARSLLEKAGRSEGSASQPGDELPPSDGLPQRSDVGLQDGDSLDGFVIGRRLGQGGMGTVFEATEPLLGRRVALKVIAPYMTDRADVRQRFIREARTAAAIEHPHALPVHRIGQVDETLYISMRYVDGPNLREVISRDVFLEPARALRIVEQVGGALDAAHALELVHRDVKPQNILLASIGGLEHAYLSDFGIARFVADTGLTRTGESLGTPMYMAPEQFSGKDVGPPADIYSLGCVLYECLTGATPFERDATIALMYAHVNDPPPRASEANSQLPKAIDNVIERALSKAPEDRYESAAEFSSAVRGALVASSVSTDANVILSSEQLRAIADAPSVTQGYKRYVSFAKQHAGDAMSFKDFVVEFGELHWPLKEVSEGPRERARKRSMATDSRSVGANGFPGTVQVVEEREDRLEFVVDGQTYVTGLAGTRCYRDLVSQFGTNEAQRVLQAAPALMARVREAFPQVRRRQPELRTGESEISVEALLLAAGVAEEKVPQIAGRYGLGSGATVELAFHRR